MNDTNALPTDDMSPGDQAPPNTEGAGEATCPDCGGTGERDAKVCETCEGTGRITQAIGGG